MDSLVTSAYTSLLLQFITGIIEATGLFLPVEPEHAMCWRWNSPYRLSNSCSMCISLR